MKRFYFSLAIILFTFAVGKAQMKPSYSINNKLLFFNFADFNSQIRGIYPELGDEIFQTEVGKHYNWDNGFCGLNLSYMQSSQKTNLSQKQTQFYGLGFGAILHRNILSKKSFNLHSSFDIGVRKYFLGLGDTKHGVSIEDVLNYPIRNYKFSNVGVYIDLGIGVNKNLTIRGTKLNVGLTGGYRFDWGEWRYEGLNHVYHTIVDLRGMFISVFFELYPQKMTKE